MSQVQLRNIHGEPIILCNIRLAVGEQLSDDAYDDRFTDLSGNTAWPNALPSSKGYNLFVNHENVLPEYEQYDTHVKDFSQNIVIVLNRRTLKQLRVDGLYFNVPHLKGNTDFLWYKRLLDGQALDDLLAQRAGAGSKFIRTFGMVDSFSKWHPTDYGNAYYDGIVKAANLLNAYGMYWYFNVFADTGLIMPGLTQQLDHYNRVVDELSKCPNVFLELVNEQGQHDNSVDRGAFTKPSSIIASSGSFGGRVAPQEPHWDFIDYHPRRDYPGSVMECNTADYYDNGKSRVSIGKPIGTGEPMKFGTGYETNNRIAKECGAAGIGVSPFNVFHSQQGVNSEMWDSQTEENAISFFEHE